MEFEVSKRNIICGFATEMFFVNIYKIDALFLKELGITLRLGLLEVLLVVSFVLAERQRCVVAGFAGLVENLFC